MPDVDSKRLFIAVKLPRNIISALEDHQKQLQKCGADAKWVEPRNNHLTLKFLGSVPAEKIKGLIEELDKLFSAQRSFQVILFELGCFPAPSSARVIWAGLEDTGLILKNIASDIEDSLQKLGFEKENREFKAHATLARIRSGQNRIALIEKLEELNTGFKKKKFSIDNITLFESKLSPKGPAYSIIHQVKFK